MMQNLLLKARAGRRMALMLRSVRQSDPAPNTDGYASNAAAERPVQQQFLKRIYLSEDRISRLTNA